MLLAHLLLVAGRVPVTDVAAAPEPPAIESTFLSIPGRVDYAFDQEGVLYVTSGSQIVRYDAEAGAFLQPWTVGTNLYGIDLAPDGMRLAVSVVGGTTSIEFEPGTRLAPGGRGQQAAQGRRYGPSQLRN